MRNFSGEKLGAKLEYTRKRHAGRWKQGLPLFLGLLLTANIFVHPPHAEFGIDAYTGFWAAFGLVVTVTMVLIMKKIIQPLLVRPEENDDLDN